MGEIRNDAAIMAALGRELTRAVAKQTVAASNLANIDTPGYRTKEVRFEDALDNELSAGSLKATNSRHFGVVDAADRSDTVDANGLSTRRDGNNVQVDHELLALNSAAGDFTAAQTVLSAKFRLVRYAINEGR
jgi:flagellar basal-body rod protein FlgB